MMNRNQQRQIATFHRLYGRPDNTPLHKDEYENLKKRWGVHWALAVDKLQHKIMEAGGGRYPENRIPIRNIVLTILANSNKERLLMSIFEKKVPVAMSYEMRNGEFYVYGTFSQD